MMDEKRKGPRLRTLKSGRLVFNGGNSTLSCTIRDLGDGGARLRFAAPCALPAVFELMVVPAGPRLPAQIAWRRGTEAGVAFG